MEFQFRGSSLPCNLNSLMDLRRAVDFSICSAFYALLAWSDDFQAPHAPDQKQELPWVCFDWLIFIIMGYIFMLLLPQSESLSCGVHLICFPCFRHHRVFIDCCPSSENSWFTYFAKFSSCVWWEGNSGPSSPSEPHYYWNL